MVSALEYLYLIRIYNKLNNLRYRQILRCDQVTSDVQDESHIPYHELVGNTFLEHKNSMNSVCIV